MSFTLHCPGIFAEQDGDARIHIIGWLCRLRYSQCSDMRALGLAGPKVWTSVSGQPAPCAPVRSLFAPSWTGSTSPLPPAASSNLPLHALEMKAPAAGQTLITKETPCRCQVSYSFVFSSRPGWSFLQEWLPRSPQASHFVPCPCLQPRWGPLAPSSSCATVPVLHHSHACLQFPEFTASASSPTGSSTVAWHLLQHGSLPPCYFQ